MFHRVFKARLPELDGAAKNTNNSEGTCMTNMKHCRFHNTLLNLRDCLEAMEEEVSEWEGKERTQLIHLCRRIADSYSDEETGEIETLPVKVL